MADDMPDGEAAVNALAEQPLDAADRALLRSLAAAFTATDGVPAGLVERLIFDVTVDDLHAEIARLERIDSLAGARAEPGEGTQTVTFTSQRLTTMVTISRASAGRVRIDGWLAPGGIRSVELEMVDSTVRTQSDENGRFAFDDVGPGPARFVIADPAAGAHETERVVVTPSLDLQPPS